jgi:uncharacterized SAM-binding protein YcdF (DUF218 family)
VQDLANNLVSPLVHVPLVLICLYFIGKFKRDPFIPKLLSIITVVWAIFCSMTYPSLLMVHALEHNYPSINADSKAWQDADAIVVLACYYFDDDELPLISRWPDCSLKRNLQAVLMHQQLATPIYVTGGKLAGAEKSHAEYNAMFLETLAVPKEYIHIVAKGHDTQSEAVALHGLKEQTIALVTSATHIERAKYYFEQQGIKVIPIPVEHLSKKNIKFVIGLPNARSIYRSERAIHEYLGLISQRLLQ